MEQITALAAARAAGEIDQGRVWGFVQDMPLDMRREVGTNLARSPEAAQRRLGAGVLLENGFAEEAGAPLATMIIEGDEHFDEMAYLLAHADDPYPARAGLAICRALLPSIDGLPADARQRVADFLHVEVKDVSRRQVEELIKELEAQAAGMPKP